MSTVELNEMAAIAAQYVNTTNRHVFLTGKAGTGKTTFLQYIVEHTYKNAVVAAPTGIAAINAGGVTLHSLLQLPFGTYVPENITLPEGSLQVNTPHTLSQKRRMRKEKLQLLQEMELLIIDEVSMLRADLLDCIDQVLRDRRRRWQEPFGGVQLLLIGDLMQLPPVVRDDEWPLLSRYYPSCYFFSAHALRNQPPLTVELNKIYRQSDQDFIDLLNRLRHNKLVPKDVEFLNQYFKADPPTKGYIHLTTHNYKADQINSKRLKELPTQLFEYSAQIEGDFPSNIFPIPETLGLKRGAQVMFVKNDVDRRFFNGKLGQVSRLDRDHIWVEFEDGTEVEVDSYEWENKRFVLNSQTNQVEENVIGTFSQYPIKLAWAVTVHKSQGLTFDKAILDVADTFAPGQLYVALSRLTSLKGLVLSSPLPTHPPAIDRSLRAFVESFADQEDLSEKLEEDQVGFLRQKAIQAFDLGKLVKAMRSHAATFDKGENRSAKQQYLPWTEALVVEAEPLQSTGAQFLKQFGRILKEEGVSAHLADRSDKAQGYFEPKLMELLQKVKHHKVQVQAKGGKVKNYLEELDALETALVFQIRQIMKLVMVVGQLAEGKLPTKEMLAQWEQDHKLNAKPPKPKKTPTAEISLKKFEAGFSVAEIAAERDLVEGTIYGHLSQYVAKGKIGLDRLVDDKKRQVIQKELAGEYGSFSEVKQRLGDEYSYGEIKLVRAWLEAQDTKDNHPEDAATE